MLLLLLLRAGASSPSVRPLICTASSNSSFSLLGAAPGQPTPHACRRRVCNGEPHTPPHVRLLLLLLLLHHLRLHHPHMITMSPAPAPARINVLSSRVHCMAMANNHVHDTRPLSSPSEPAHSTRPAPPSSNLALSAHGTITYTATRPSLVRTRLAAGKDDQFPPILQAAFTYLLLHASRHQPPLPPLRLIMAASLPNQALACCLPTPLNGCMGGCRQQPSFVWTLDTGSAIPKLCAMPPPMPSHLFVACSTHVHTYMLYKTGTRLACACDALLQNRPAHCPAQISYRPWFALTYYRCSTRPILVMGQANKYLLQLCSVSGLQSWLVRWLQNQHGVAGHQQPPRNIMHSPLPHVTCNAIIKSLVIFNASLANSRIPSAHMQSALDGHAKKCATHPFDQRMAARDPTNILRKVDIIRCPSNPASAFPVPCQKQITVRFVLLLPHGSGHLPRQNDIWVSFIPPSLDSSEPSLHLATLSTFAAKGQISSCANSSTTAPSIISCSTAA
ncbi:hypothetical protein COCMIDRAFT_28876 [Bipolaris oryzae ATCC 44560]|uniref:Ig-like domain-containing protein n=1 Tax=Bipolaris oryzae ATCC 44560 TaxID=930090 RepID=W6ZG61_COCMI|nr:uncharacterized protein COCMIDRAFT_28876 [Bipolaris oryzae ATCC 44560]EUC42491.1 hypothetical protein COCMIDRAFT_28876 [Bipolaris oryzae ATCC 44560]